MSKTSIRATFRGGSKLFFESMLFYSLLAIFEAFGVTVSAYFFGDESSGLVYIHMLASVLIMFFTMSAVIVTASKRMNWRELREFSPPDSILWAVPTLLVASLLYTLSILIGFLALIIPALIALVVFSYVPYMAVFYQSDKSSDFRKSFEFSKYALGATIFFTLLSLVAELPSMLFQNQYFTYQFLILFISALLTNYLQVLFLFLFHSLCLATEVGHTSNSHTTNS